MNNTTGQTPGITTTSGAADLPEARPFTKKPVTIAAIQWTGKNLREVITFTDGPPDARTTHAGMAWEAYTDLVARDGLKIYTLEGKMLANPGDWIIRGVKGEYYPCKPDIFEATYSPAALAAGQATAAPAGDWLWVKLMDFCKKRGFAPANFNDLFEIVDAARAARAPADSAQEDADRHFFDAGWKACANFCDREDVRFDGIVGHRGCPQFEEAFRAARKQGATQ